MAIGTQLLIRHAGTFGQNRDRKVSLVQSKARSGRQPTPEENRLQMGRFSELSHPNGNLAKTTARQPRKEMAKTTIAAGANPRLDHCRLLTGCCRILAISQFSRFNNNSSSPIIFQKYANSKLAATANYTAALWLFNNSCSFSFG